MTIDQLIAAAAVEAQLCRAAAELRAALGPSLSMGQDAQACWQRWIDHRNNASAYLDEAYDRDAPTITIKREPREPEPAPPGYASDAPA